MVPGSIIARAGWCLLALGLVVGIGCKAGPYEYGKFHSDEDAAVEGAVVVKRGEPHKVLDSIAWLVGLPARILPLNNEINSHAMSPETETSLVAYLEKNDLRDVYVCVNHYDPGLQWQRLAKNSLVAPVWRYSFGVVHLIGYTLLPNRIFGGDNYDPFTNSIYANSDVPAVLLHEAAYAKDVHARKYPGFYAALNDLPIVTIWHHSRAVKDVLGYARCEHDWETERQTYCVVYPQVGAESATLVGPLFNFWWSGPVLRLCGATVGHVTGRTAIAKRETELKSLAAAPEAADGDGNGDGDVKQVDFVTSSAGEKISARIRRLPAILEPDEIRLRDVRDSDGRDRTDKK